MKNAREYLKELVNKRNRAELINFLANLLGGAYIVDVNTGELQEAEYGAVLFGDELVSVLKALGVESVPTELLSGMGDRKYDSGIDISIGQLTHLIEYESARGLLLSIIDGCTQVEAGTDKVMYCYGRYPQSYATIKEVMGRVTMEDIHEDLHDYVDCVDDETFIDLIDSWIEVMRG